MKIELLAPAGSSECAKVAVDSGADAIYMGGAKYGAREFAKSTIEDNLLDTIRYVKNRGVKFYLTVNTLFKQKELKEIFLFLDPFVDAGVDAFIVQDLGVAMMLKERYKNVELHASTQMNITSSKGIKLVEGLGFKQVVLARELSLKEIKNIRKEVGDNIRLEAFVHGSMCYAYSGTCLMSSFIGKESGNRGRCKGPCRLPYDRANDKKLSLKEPYILSMKDMCALDFLYDLIHVGVDSFKIEGRMRQETYVSGVTKIYRKYIDFIMENINLQKSEFEEMFKKNLDIEKDKNVLIDLYNKGGFTNYYNKHNGCDMIQRFER